MRFKRVSGMAPALAQAFTSLGIALLFAYVAKSADVCSLETKDPLAPHVPVVYFGESFVHDSHGININSVALECLGENLVACGLSIIFCVFRGFFGTIGLSTATIQRKLQP